MTVHAMSGDREQLTGLAITDSVTQQQKEGIA
jgi:hypothetical protein